VKYSKTTGLQCLGLCGTLHNQIQDSLAGLQCLGLCGTLHNNSVCDSFYFKFNVTFLNDAFMFHFNNTSILVNIKVAFIFLL